MWIRRIMINALIDEYRKKKVRNEHIKYVDDYDETASYSDLNPSMSQLDLNQITELIQQLPPMSQKVFNLFVIDGYSHKEISNLLEMSEGTSKWHVNAAKSKLKEMIIKIVPLIIIPPFRYD